MKLCIMLEWRRVYLCAQVLRAAQSPGLLSAACRPQWPPLETQTHIKIILSRRTRLQKHLNDR